MSAKTEIFLAASLSGSCKLKLLLYVFMNQYCAKSVVYFFIRFWPLSKIFVFLFNHHHLTRRPLKMTVKTILLKCILITILYFTRDELLQSQFICFLPFQQGFNAIVLAAGEDEKTICTHHLVV